MCCGLRKLRNEVYRNMPAGKSLASRLLYSDSSPPPTCFLFLLAHLRISRSNPRSVSLPRSVVHLQIAFVAAWTAPMVPGYTEQAASVPGPDQTASTTSESSGDLAMPTLSQTSSLSSVDETATSTSWSTQSSATSQITIPAADPAASDDDSSTRSAGSQSAGSSADPRVFFTTRSSMAIEQSAALAAST